MNFRNLWPAAVFAFLVIAFSVWFDRRSQPDGDGIRQVDAMPASAPGDLHHWRPPADGEWRTFDLPVRVCQVKCTTPYTAWRLRFDWQADRQPDPALYLPNLDANAAIYLNGSLIERRGDIIDPPSVYRYEPRLLRLPLDLLEPGENELTWLLVIERRGIGGVGRIHIDSWDKLAANHASLLTLTETLPSFSLWLQLACFVFALALMLRGSKEPFVRWFLWLSPFWILSVLGHLVPDWIGAPPWRFAVFHTSIFGLLAFSSLFVISILDEPAVRFKRMAFAFFGVGAVLSFGANFWPDVDGYWRIALPHFTAKYATFVILPFTLWQLGKFLSRERDSGLARWVFAAAMLPLICGLHDAIRGSFGLMSFTLTPLAGVGISAAFCIELGRRVLANQSRMARYSEELAATVRIREEELAANYVKLREADREIALGHERRRIMQDMHDGVAGQLSALVHLANDPTVGRTEIIGAVRMGLADLRLVLDSLAQADGNVMHALGSLRGRVAPLLSAAGIELDWSVDEVFDEDGMPPGQLLHVLRIVQEAIHNTIRHSRATKITMIAARTGDSNHITVADNGIGMAQDADQRGHYGLAGMHERAKRLGGMLRICSTPEDGTRIELSWPTIFATHENRTST